MGFELSNRIQLKSQYYPLMRDKIGNLLVRFCKGKGKEIPESFALKLLFMVDLTSVMKTGVPITFIDYFAYQRGPVATDVHYVLKCEFKKHKVDEKIKLSHFVEVFKEEEKPQTTTHFKIKALTSFDEMIFSDYEISIIDEVMLKYGNKSANSLSNLTHEIGSLWDKARINNNLDAYFALNKCSHSDFPVHFTELIDTPAKTRAYQNAKYSLEYLSAF